MISLPDFLKENNKQDLIDYTFEDYCYENLIDIDKFSENNKKFIENQYISLLRGTEFLSHDYEGFQEYLYEGVLSTYSAYRLVEKIKDLNEYKDFWKIEVIENKKGKVNPIYIYGEKKFIDDKQFQQLLTFYNYEASWLDTKECIFVKPIKGEDITNYVYSLPYIYHFTPKFIYENKIQKYGLKQKIKKGTNYGKIYFFYTKNDPIKEMKPWAKLKNRRENKDYKDFVILKIDLSKLNNRIKFFEDDESNNDNTFYTFEFIPASCITVYKEFDI